MTGVDLSTSTYEHTLFSSFIQYKVQLHEFNLEHTSDREWPASYAEEMNRYI
jgi:hypothetical protein